MTETILALVPTYGLPFLFGVAVLAAAGLPLSSSMTLLVVGAFVATGDLSFVSSFITALSGAVIGDQIGYQIGLHAGSAVEARLSRKPSRAKQISSAKKFIDRYGGLGVFLTRWLMAPIGPLTNIICGASDMRWLRFSVWDFAGEVVWVSLYIGIGYMFRGNLVELAGMLGDASWLLIVAIVALLLGARLLIVLRQHKKDREAQ